MGFGKNLFLGERVKFAIHVDTFNTFNHHQYAGDVGALITAGSGGNETISSGVGAANFGQTTQSVSYTHLDVYKRQAQKLPSAARICWCARKSISQLSFRPMRK